MVDSHCASRRNRQLIAAIRRFYRYTLRNFFLAHVQYTCTIAPSRTNTKARFKQSWTTSAQKKNICKIVTEMHRWNPENYISCVFIHALQIAVIVRFT